MLERTITDHRGGPDGTLRGQAVFEPDGGGLRLTESGILRLGSYENPVRRVTLWRFSAPGHASVHFADGRFFHTLEVTAGKAETLHLCGDDRYAGAFDFAANGWHARWRVTGPRKDYTMVSHHRRRPAAP